MTVLIEELQIVITKYLLNIPNKWYKELDFIWHKDLIEIIKVPILQKT